MLELPFGLLTDLLPLTTRVLLTTPCLNSVDLTSSEFVVLVIVPSPGIGTRKLFLSFSYFRSETILDVVTTINRLRLTTLLFLFIKIVFTNMSLDKNLSLTVLESVKLRTLRCLSCLNSLFSLRKYMGLNVQIHQPFVPTVSTFKCVCLV